MWAEGGDAKDGDDEVSGVNGRERGYNSITKTKNVGEFRKMTIFILDMMTLRDHHFRR